MLFSNTYFSSEFIFSFSALKKTHFLTLDAQNNLSLFWTQCLPSVSVTCDCRRWWAPPSPPRCVRSSWWRRAVWWSDRWRAVWRRVMPPQRRASCSDRWTWRLARSARPSATCCSTCATTPAAASRSDATTRPPTPSWPWPRAFSPQWGTLVSLSWTDSFLKFARIIAIQLLRCFVGLLGVLN